MPTKVLRTCLALAAAALTAFAVAGCVKEEAPKAEAAPPPPASVSKKAPDKTKTKASTAKLAPKPAPPAAGSAAANVALAKPIVPVPARLGAAATPTAPKAPAEGKAGKAHVAEPTADLGDIKRGETGKHTFVIKNTGKDVLTIKRAKGT